MRLDSHTQLPNNCLRPFIVRRVAFPEYFCTNNAVFALYGEDVVRFPPLPDDVFFKYLVTADGLNS